VTIPDVSTENTEKKVGEGAISGNQASIPAEVREAADIEDGDRIRWYWEGGELRVEVVRRRNDRLPGDFDGFEPEAESADHDEVGLETSGEIDAGG
jgi:bifunctional DNA-binding transcriptional regulator/antitoxin component of YhaV-PrlF toxin-antitoxin module